MGSDGKDGGTRGKSVCAAILRRVESVTADRLVLLSVGAGLILILLGVMGLVLELDDDQGMTRFLRLEADHSSIACGWKDHGVWWLALAYLGIDALIFVPLYGVLLIGISGKVATLNPNWPRQHMLMCAIVLFSLAAMVADEIENGLGLWALLANDLNLPTWAQASATLSKWLYFFCAVGLLLLSFLRWFLALGDSSRRPDTALNVLERALLRFAVSDVIWRSRYVLATLVFFAGLVLALNQSRDVLAGIAHGWQSGLYPGAAFAMIVSAVSIWALAYACWMWTRILCRLRRPTSFRDAIKRQSGVDRAADPRTWPSEAHQFAKWWARLLGAAPVLMLVWLCGLAARDAVRAEALSSAYLLLGFGAMTTVGAIVFLWGRSADSKRTKWPVAPDAYFEYKGDSDGARGELHLERYRFLGLAQAPTRLPIAALLLLLALRGLNLWLPDQPPLTLAVICSAMTLWVGVVGLLAQYTLRSGFPVLGLLVLVVGGLGWAGVADNHVAWKEMAAAIPPLPMSDMWFAQAAIAFLLMAGALMTWRMATGWRRYLFGGALLATVMLGPRVADCVHTNSAGATACFGAAEDQTGGLGGKQSATASGEEWKSAKDPRQTLEEALVAWLEHLCGRSAGESNRCQGPESLTVYFVSAEGGGIRAAYWPALVLAELSARITEFDRRTFSLSGVSGGAVGISIYRVCRERHPGDDGIDRLRTCIRSLGARDLLTPLLGSWMFEDVLARFIPTYWCAQPGCGFLSRGAWFERALEEGVAESDVDLRKPLASLSRSGSTHLPHLFLNSTWVETGERAIASDVRIASNDFPTARDQIEFLGLGLPVSTAAHNAARFPYVNAIGSVRIPAARCSQSAQGNAEVICGHLADGGYFDNSGGHTTGDILRTLRQVLHSGAIGGLRTEQRDWLRAHLVPQVVMIRNDVFTPTAASRDKAELPCDSSDKSRPRCAGQMELFVDFLGPVVTAIAAGGIGANGRLGESLQAKAVDAVRPETVGVDNGERAARNQILPVVDINLEQGKVMYPLGWYLSRHARCNMEQIASDDAPYEKACAGGACRTNQHDQPAGDPQCAASLS